MSELTLNKAFAWMAVGVINGHFPHPTEWALNGDSDPMGACCVINCGPCAALHWISQEPGRRNEFEAQIMLTDHHVGGWAYWNDETCGLDWDWFEAYWAQHTTCGMSNGVPTGCDFEDDEDDEPNTNPKETP